MRNQWTTFKHVYRFLSVCESIYFLYFQQLILQAWYIGTYFIPNLLSYLLFLSSVKALSQHIKIINELTELNCNRRVLLVQTIFAILIRFVCSPLRSLVLDSLQTFVSLSTFVLFPNWFVRSHVQSNWMIKDKSEQLSNNFCPNENFLNSPFNDRQELILRKSFEIRLRPNEIVVFFFCWKLFLDDYKLKKC